MRVQIRRLDGCTAFVDGVDGIENLFESVAAIEGVPTHLLRLKSGAKELVRREPMLHGAAGSSSLRHGASVDVLLRIEGGKGGFGAMLRTAGAKGIKTTNFDSCRDLNGRRLKHVNAEAKLREWDAKAEERKLAKQREDALNAKPTGPPSIARFDEEEYEEMLEGARGRVTDALAAGLAAARTAQDAAHGSEGESSRSGGGGSGGNSDSVSTCDGKTAATTAGAGGEVALKALGKRKAPADAVPPTADAVGAPHAKATKVSVAFDPLAAFGGDDSDEDEDEDDEAAAV